MTTTHTPGPWEWVGRDLESNFPGHYESVIESTVDCGAFCYGGMVNMKISDADRRLITAAPELLEALVALHAVAFTESDSDYGTVANAAAAIAKATGAA